MRKCTAFIILIVVFMSVCGTRNGTQGPESNARDFTLTSVEGLDYTLSALQGKVVLIDFWATWCPPCRNSIPVLISLYDKYGDQGFIVLGISNESKATLTKYQADNNVNYPILIDTKKVGQAYGVQSIPNMFIFDRKGKERKHQVGFSPEMEAGLIAFIDSLLNE